MRLNPLILLGCIALISRPFASSQPLLVLSTQRSGTPPNWQIPIHVLSTPHLPAYTIAPPQYQYSKQPNVFSSRKRPPDCVISRSVGLMGAMWQVYISHSVHMHLVFCTPASHTHLLPRI
ncbi:hypothetical protein BGZ60DRAFT_411231 [Tricladium varicosporioides]|nr:hypothetical protein BGZ60DRAFT_411231 [Hymenoscyphus varicosporioides]